jgi:FkbM family methyltransferase
MSSLYHSLPRQVLYFLSRSFWGIFLKLPLPDTSKRIVSLRIFGFSHGEPKVKELLLTMLLDKPFVDVGACAGTYSKIMLKRAPMVIAIEADPLNMAMLRRELASASEKVRYVNLAVGNTRAKVPFYRHSDVGSGSVSPFKRGLSHSFDISVVPLADIVKEPVGLVKVDVEGAEVSVVEGAIPAMDLIASWVIEAHTKENGVLLEGLLRSHNYNVVWIDENHIYAKR